MILLRLFWEFFKTGLFAVGGGMATLPFLYDMSTRTGWFTQAKLADMIAVSESTPGPIGVNMATYVGFETAGIPGAVTATLGLICPSIIIILIIARVLKQFRENKTVDAAFYGLRPCSIALIAAAGLLVAKITFLNPEVLETGNGIASYAGLFQWKAIALAAVLDAPYEELLKVEGVGENTAVFCKLLPQLMGRYQQSQDGRREIINSVQRAGEVIRKSVQRAGEVIRKCFVGQTEEVVYLHCLDAKGKVLGRRLICRGSVNSASVSPRKLVETAMAFNASGVILSHNHTSGLALPSQEDIETTRRIGKALAAVEISLIDHIIVADDDFVSLANCGYIDQE